MHFLLFAERRTSVAIGQATLSVHSVAFKYESELTLDSLQNITFIDEEEEEEETVVMPK